ncbi:MAG: N-acetyl-gamma-glutamyl-phosphate reductase [Endomicrobium sp.]|nr:N-acetyl-gamma-glutamyl-phosphate reductase [Endomicrobium sp.]
MIRVGIVGITGYTGEELLKILSNHSDVHITGLYGRSSSRDRSLKDIYSYFSHLDLKIEGFDVKKVVNRSDVVFLALPHAVSFEIVAPILDAGVKVIDLSADFRLSAPKIYEKWYNVEHTAKEYISDAVYGLSELNADKIKQASLVANPGCYPTSIILGCAPAVTNKLVDLNGIVIDSKSGISGGGRKKSQEYFSSEHPNFKAYKIAGEHRHIPEIEQELSNLSGESIKVSFTPHIIPIERGMLSTIYLSMLEQVSTAFIIEAYRKFYSGKQFIKILNKGIVSGVKDVLNTNYCAIGIKVDKRTNKLMVVSVIDNLVKGASGQAVQNMNIMFGLSESTGLL